MERELAGLLGGWIWDAFELACEYGLDNGEEIYTNQPTDQHSMNI